MTTTRFKLSFGLGLLLAGAGFAHAVPMTLDLSEEVHGPQSTSAPCIIAGTQCQNPANFGFTNYVQGGGPSSDNDVDSPEYTIDKFPFLTFDVAIDVNTNAQESETLQLFSVFVDADGAAGPGGFEEIYNFTGPAAIGGTSNSGQGFSDWILGTIDLTQYEDDALVFFNAVWDDDVAGAESFFLVQRSPPKIPEPATLMMVGLGLLGIGLSGRRRPQIRR